MCENNLHDGIVWHLRFGKQQSSGDTGLYQASGLLDLWNSDMFLPFRTFILLFVCFFFLLKELALVFGTSSKPSYSKFATWFPVPHFCMPTKRHLGPIYRSDLGWAATNEGIWGCLQHMRLLGPIKTVSQGGLRLVPGVWVVQTSSHHEPPFCFSWFPSLEVVVMPSNISASEGEELFCNILVH